MFNVHVLLVLVLLAVIGCAAQSISSRPIYSDTSSLVRLDSFSQSPASDAYDHPVDLTEAELALILSQLLAHQSVGMFEQKPVSRPVFDSNDVRLLSTYVKEAFRRARPTEWIAFYLAKPKGTGQEVTSGGFFAKGRELHVLLANIGAQNLADAKQADAVRANPMYVLSARGTTVSFEQSRYVLATRSRWTGDAAGAPASELVLDKNALLRDVRPLAAGEITPASLQPPAGSAMTVTESGDGSLREQLLKLEEHVKQLQGIVEEQTQEIAKLKARLAELEAARKSAKKPGR